MVGLSRLEFAKPSKDAGSGYRALFSRRKEWAMSSTSIVRGGSGPAPSPLLDRKSPMMERKIHTGIEYNGNAMAAPVSSGRELPVIDRSKVDPEVLKAAEGLETMFLDYMMKTMRQTIPKNDMDMESPATDIYRGMLDSEYAQKAAHRGGIGLSDQIIAYLEARRYNLPEGQGVPRKEKP
jgi:flagellar protein FlgJ